MHLCCQRQLMPMLSLIESYSGTRAWAAMAADTIAAKSAASIHLIGARDGTDVSERQAWLIRRANTADQEGLGGALVGERRIIGRGERRPLHGPPLHHEFLADEQRLIGLAGSMEDHGSAVENASGRPQRQQHGPRLVVVEQQASVFI